MVDVAEKVQGLERDFAVHLTECTGRHKAIATKIDSVEAKLDKHITDTAEYRKSVVSTTQKIQQYLLFGFMGVIFTVLFGADNGLRLLSTILKGG